MGYICYGPTPMTRHTFDLYWIIVDPDRRREGLGKSLLARMEKDLSENSAKIVRVETSSKENYGAAARFYSKEGFDVAGNIADFYADGDDLVIYSKTLR